MHQSATQEFPLAKIDNETTTDSYSRSRSHSHKGIFILIAWLIPVLFLVVTEGTLRLVGFGADYPLFVELPQQPHYLEPNPDVIKRFFTDPDQAPNVSIDTNYFLKQKPENGLRIVIQGGSSAAGFPYGKNASPAGMLQQRLVQTFPDNHVEVILTAMSAVNSYTLLEFADEIIAIQPDAVLVYAGHNEFIGVLGVGSSFGSGNAPGLTHLFLKLRDLRLVQLIQNLLTAVKPDAAKRSGTLMATIARERSIPFESGLFERGVDQFRSNLRALLKRYHTAGVPVFIGTLASNEKDQAPFLGEPVNLASDKWKVTKAHIKKMLDERDFSSAQEVAQTLVTEHPDAADSHFMLGQALLGVSSLDAAADSFRLAIDHDRLRFRAPGIFNDIIRETASGHGATVVDVHGRFQAASKDNLIGRKLMLEHLHPNAPGYFLLADAYYDAIIQSNLAAGRKNLIRDERAQQTQPLSKIEVIHGDYRLGALLNDWPFVEHKQTYTPPTPANFEQQVARDWYRGKLDYLGAMNQALVHYQKTRDFEEAARIAINLADSFPFEAQPQHVAGMMLVQQAPPKGERAIPFFERAVELSPTNATYLATLSRAYIINGYPQKAQTTARNLLKLAPNNPVARQILSNQVR